MRRNCALVVAVFALLTSCGPQEETPRVESGIRSPVREDAADSASDAELVEAAEVVIQFLRGELPFSELRTADTVSLRPAPEGGGSPTQLVHEALADPASWVVTTGAGDRRSLVPPRALTQLTARPGVHFNCFEYSLASRSPDLARLPHVGVRLTGSEAGTCLQTWNLTLVFDTVAGPPVLRAVVYDQWEW
jgi:hypothetical protein